MIRVPVPIDKLGSCPHCKESWDDGDIFEKLNLLSVNAMKSQKDVGLLARAYGWTPEDPTRFSKTNVAEIETPVTTLTFLQCHKCNHVFETKSGWHYQSMYDARQAILDPQEETEIE